MLTEQEIKTLINKEVIEDVEAISLIRKFIFDKTGKDIKGINRPKGEVFIKDFQFESDFDIMFKMLFVAKSHYLETLK